MPEKMNIDAGAWLNAPEIQKLAGRREEVERLAASEDGKRVIRFLEESDIENAVRSGDMNAAAEAVRAALATEEGARLADMLRVLIK
ncbi:MAG: hypothetical protein LBC28_04025 [Oscillospiraceae bacterium]|jgi:hypothetical protein|nr:hypothetical protein [Oscillospiraceae bacterium]